jgi:hypothetical protein
LLKPDFEAVAARLFDKVGYALHHKEDFRQRFSVLIRASASPGFDALFAALSTEALKLLMPERAVE